jgi:hypothetical protein
MLGPRYAADGRAAISLNPGQLAARDNLRRKIDTGVYPMESESRLCLICSGRDFAPLAQKDRYGLPVSVVACRLEMREFELADAGEVGVAGTDAALVGEGGGLGVGG